MSLLKSGSPLAVFRRVIAVVVYSLKGEALGRNPHVCVEVDELPPAFADFDSSTAIIFKCHTCRAGTSGKHVIPYRIERDFRQAMRSKAFLSIAAARNILSEFTAVNQRLVSADAPTKNIGASCGCLRENGEDSKSLMRFSDFYFLPFTHAGIIA